MASSSTHSLPLPIIPQYVDENNTQVFKVNLKVPPSKQTRKVKYILRYGKLPPKRSITWSSSNDVQSFAEYLGRTSMARPLKKRRVTPHPRRRGALSAAASSSSSPPQPTKRALFTSMPTKVNKRAAATRQNKVEEEEEEEEEEESTGDSDSEEEKEDLAMKLSRMTLRSAPTTKPAKRKRSAAAPVARNGGKAKK